MTFWPALRAEPTRAHCIPAVEKIDNNSPTIQTLIHVPTYEMALQNTQICVELGKHMDGNVSVLHVVFSFCHVGQTNADDEVKCVKYKKLVSRQNANQQNKPGKILVYFLFKRGVSLFSNAARITSAEVPTVYF